MKRLIALVLLATLLPLKALGAAPADLSTPKVAHIIGEITPLTEFAFEMEMLRTADLPGDRLILIDSPGGYVDAGQEMLNLIEKERQQGTRVVCVVTRQASSMAFNILTHCDVRLATSHAYMVVHKIALASYPPDTRLTAKELRREADELERLDDPYRRANARAMHLPLSDYDLFADKETCWAAKALLRLGYLNGLVDL